jgi:hypothetical protein
MMGRTGESTVTAWEPGRHFAQRGEPDPETGLFMAFEYLIEGREGGSTVLRFVHSGVLGDDWEDQYDALKVGDGMYLRKLAAYVKHFPGRTSSYNLFLPGPQVAEKAPVWAAFGEAFGLEGAAEPGAPARLSVPGLAPVEGVVEFSHEPDFLGVRTADAIYMLIHGYLNAVVVEQHSFAEPGAVDEKQTEVAWQNWLAGFTQ